MSILMKGAIPSWAVGLRDGPVWRWDPKGMGGVPPPRTSFVLEPVLTASFFLIASNFSVAAASSKFAWANAWRLGSTSQ